MFTFDEIIQAVTGAEVRTGAPAFKEASVDSRAVGAGTLFAAIPGEVTDGHKFIASAFEKGASAALIEEDVPDAYPVIDLREGFNADADLSAVREGKPYLIRVKNTVEALQQTAKIRREDMADVQVIGITGTVGKTSTKEVVGDLLATKYRTLKTAGNMNNEIGLPLTLLHAEAGIEKAILEMGFYVPGEIAQLCDIGKPSVGIVTNVGMVHASRAGSMEVIAAGKSELVQALPENGTAILNYDDPYVRPMAEKARASVLYYGTTSEADLYASELESDGLNGIRCKLNCHGETYNIVSPLIGSHSVYTALRAAAAGIVCGMSREEIEAGLRVSRNMLRMNILHTPSGALVIDDTYNASPASTIAALNLLAEMKGTKYAVLGEMRELGQYEVKGHAMVGKRAAQVADEVIAVGPATKHLADAALEEGMNTERVHWFETVAESIAYLKMLPLDEGTAMLVKGSRGMRMEQIIEALEAKA